MKLKNPENLTLAELPEYYLQAVKHLKKHNTGHVKPWQLKMFLAAHNDLVTAQKSMIETLGELNRLIELTKVINT